MRLSDQRSLFEIPDDVAYLNTATLAAQLRSVTDAGVAAVARKAKPWTITTKHFFAESEELRALAASVMGVDAEGVALVPSASYGLAVAAHNLGIGPASRVLVIDRQFPSNVYTWSDRGATLITVARPDGEPWTPSVVAAIERERPDVVAIPVSHWTDGAVVDLGVVHRACAEVGAELVVDASQSMGAMPLDVCDYAGFVVTVGYKWLLGPYSLGYLYVADRHRNGQPIESNWITRAGSEDFSALVNYTSELDAGARRFDVGERSNFVLVPMAAAALRQILEWGVDAIGETISDYTRQIEDGTRALGFEPVPEKHRVGHMLGVCIPGGVPDGLADRLAGERVYVSVRGDSVRVSPHVHTTETDVERLLAVLGEL